MWTQEPAPSSTTRIVTLDESNLASEVVEAMTQHVRRILGDRKLHSSEDIREQVHSLRPNDNATVDAFLIVANHVARADGDLPATVRLREWAEANRKAVMR